MQQLWDAAPGGSYRKLNNALHMTLAAAIEAKVQVGPDDFEQISDDFRGGYWQGDGERYYCLAVEHGNTPACVSFERWAKRPAALWCEDAKTPQRLCIGSEFTWDGLQLKVTSMSRASFIACAYAMDSDAAEYGEPMEGRIAAFANNRRVLKIVEQADGQWVKLSKPCKPEPDGRIPTRKVTITYAELAEARRKMDALVRNALKSVAETVNKEALEMVASALHLRRTEFRHFDIETIRASYKAQLEHFDKVERDARNAADIARSIAERATPEWQAAERKRIQQQKQRLADRLARWRAGGDVREWFEGVALRVNGDFVETSTGQRETLASVKRLLPWAIRQKGKCGPVTGKRLARFPVVEVKETGVVVGCTEIPWLEIEALHAKVIADHGQPPT